MATAVSSERQVSESSPTQISKVRHAIEIFRLYQKPWLRIADHFGLLKKGESYVTPLRNGLRNL